MPLTSDIWWMAHQSMLPATTQCIELRSAAPWLITDHRLRAGCALSTVSMRRGVEPLRQHLTSIVAEPCSATQCSVCSVRTAAKAKANDYKHRTKRETSRKRGNGKMIRKAFKTITHRNEHHISFCFLLISSPDCHNSRLGKPTGSSVYPKNTVKHLYICLI